VVSDNVDTSSTIEDNEQDRGAETEEEPREEPQTFLSNSGITPNTSNSDTNRENNNRTDSNNQYYNSDKDIDTVVGSKRPDSARDYLEETDSDTHTELEEDLSFLDTNNKKTRNRANNDLLQWRRAHVYKMYVKGKTINQIAEHLQVSTRTIERDLSWLDKHSQYVLKEYFVDTLPKEVTKSLARLEAVNDAAWLLVEAAQEKGQGKLAVDALRLAKDTAKDITEIVTNNKSLIDTAYEVSEDKEKELSELDTSLYETTKVVAETVTKTNTGVCDNSSSSCRNDSSATHTNNTNTIINHSDINSSSSSTSSNSIYL
jgi:hypothetical protein